MTLSRDEVRLLYAEEPEEYDRYRLEDPRGRILTERDRFLVRTLLPQLPTVGSALEVGAGTGRFTPLAVAHFERLVATDVNEAMLQRLRLRMKRVSTSHRWNVRIEDVFSLSMGSSTVDAVLAVHVFPRFEDQADQQAMLAEVARVLRPGGRFLFNFRNRRSLYGVLHRGHAISWNELASMMSTVGLVPIRRKGKHLLTRKTLDCLPVVIGRFLARGDVALENVAPHIAWDVFVVAERT